MARLKFGDFPKFRDQAKLDLQQVPSPMAGHRANAIRLTGQAIAEGQAGIEFDSQKILDGL